MSKRFATALPAPSSPSLTEAYATFDAIDGRHPWQESVPNGYVLYPTRRLGRGRVLYFNFVLAREMGLIPVDHGNEMTAALHKKLIDTFALQIVNEYDQAHGGLEKHDLKTHPYMATRYLQMQHADKRGTTSGDGRGIWNGVWSHRGQAWDISSRGTGVTCLAPGAVAAQRPLKTGGDEYGYGCGQADVSELLGSAILSEIFHLNSIKTERVLAVIDLGKGFGVGVRAAPNLLRPAHLFLYLKQGRRTELKQATDHLIRRMCGNRQWSFSSASPDRYQCLLRQVSTDFARFAARLEREYIFTWMEWDGDNILADAGIIDYGSIRQFGLRHDQYRYDDIERFSTNLNEQRGRARLQVQVFAQLVHFLETGKRRAIEEFAECASAQAFDRQFERSLREIFLSQVGFDGRQSQQLMSTGKHRAKVERLYQSFLVLEKTKTKAGSKRLPDGVNRAAVFNMRKALRELPQILAREGWQTVLPSKDLLELMTSSKAKRADLRLKRTLRLRLERFQTCYLEVLRVAANPTQQTAFLKGIAQRAEIANRPARVTGNGAEFIVEAILKALRRGLSTAEAQHAVMLFIASQVPPSALVGRHPQAVSLQSNTGRLYHEMLNIAAEFEDDI